MVYLYHIRGPPARNKKFDTLKSQEGSGFSTAPLSRAGPSHSARLRLNLYSGERVGARSVRWNRTGPANMVTCQHEGGKREVRRAALEANQGKA